MKVKITNTEELEIDINELKKIRNFDVDDIFRYGRSITGESKILLMDDNEYSEEDEHIKKRVFTLLMKKA